MRETSFSMRTPLVLNWPRIVVGGRRLDEQKYSENVVFVLPQYCRVCFELISLRLDGAKLGQSVHTKFCDSDSLTTNDSSLFGC